MRAIRLSLLALFAMAATVGQTRADQIFDFSFTNQTGSVNGTVSGFIDLAFNGNGSGAATQAVITSQPTIFTTEFAAPPINLLGLAHVPLNSFTVTGGAITSVQFSANTLTGVEPIFEMDNLGATWELAAGADSPSVISSTLTFTPAESTTPEPASLVLLSTGLLAGFGVIRLRRQR